MFLSKRLNCISASRVTGRSRAPLVAPSRRPRVCVLTIVLLVQALEDQPQFLLVVPEIMNKLLKVQLSVQVFVSCLQYFLEREETRLILRSFWCW